MPIKHIPSLRSRLVLLTVAVMVPAFLMATIVLVYNYQQQRAELIRESMASARTLMRLIDRELATAEVSLIALSTSPSIAAGDYQGLQNQAQQVLRRSFINNVVLVNPQGQQLMNTAVPFGAPLPRTAVMDQVERVLQSGQTDIAPLTLDAVLKRPVISMAVPVGDESRPSHALLGVVLPSHFQRILDAYDLPGDRITAVFDRSGTIVARSVDVDRFLGKSVAPGLVERLKQSDEAAFEVVTLEGVPVVSTYTRSPTTRWGVAVGIPEKALTADLRRSMWILVGVALTLFGLSIGMAWLLGGQIARNVSALRRPAQQLGNGEAVDVARLDIREVNDVAEALKRASALQLQTMQQLADNDARLRGIVESAMDAIITVDEHQTIEMFNTAAVSMFGCPSEQAIGTSLTRFIPERFHARNQLLLLRREQALGTDGEDAVPRPPEGLSGVTVALRASGEEFPAEVSFSSVAQSGHILHTLIVRDVTSRVRAYQALERSNLDLQQFAFVASHDLKTPLRSISGFVQMLARNHADQLDDKGLSLIQRTISATQRLEQLTEDLLSYARVDAETRSFAPVDMGEVAHEVLHLLDASVTASGAVVEVAHLPVVQGDRTQLAQLLMNLIGNALKYCRGRAPVVRVSASRQPSAAEWEFAVSDNGIGIEGKHLQKVFEVFKRLHTQDEYPGTGIGLAICRRVVEGHGGRIWVTSVPGEGSTFSFTLPAQGPDTTP